jgi:hypothetical protein
MIQASCSRLAPAMVSATLLGVLGAAGCDEAPPPAGARPAASTPVDPADFVAEVDNPFHPLVPGTRLRYEGTTDDGAEVVVVQVTNQTRRIQGVPSVVVRDTVTVAGEVVEDTYDWYAQDRHGNVWYLGEATKEYENGKVTSTAGSWEAGVDGAEAGIVMPARPRVGGTYRQEYYVGQAEDMAQVLSVTKRAAVPFGTFKGVVETKDYTRLEPDVVEHKYYARGVGLVLEIMVEGGSERLRLVDVSRPPGGAG